MVRIKPRLKHNFADGSADDRSTSVTLLYTLQTNYAVSKNVSMYVPAAKSYVK